MSIAVPTCNDGIMNGNETDVDCGDGCLPTKRCDDGLRCKSGLDCNSGVCTLNICQGQNSYLQCKQFALLSCSFYLQRHDQ